MRLFSRPAIFIAVAVSLLGQTTVMASGLDAWLAAHPISTVTKTVTSSVRKPTSSNIAPSAFTRCPINCSDAGYDPASWDAYHSVARLALCNQAMLLDFSLYNSLDDHLTHTSIRSCTADSQNDLDTLAEKKVTSASFSPGITVPMLQSNATLQLAWIDADNDKKGSTPDVTNVVQQIDDFLDEQSTGKEGISFALAGETVVGVFAGSQIQQQGLVPSILQDFVAEVKDRGISDSLFVQLCGKTRSSKYALGVVASVQSDISFVQSAVKTWKEGKCVTSFSGSSAWKSITLSVPSSSTSSSNSTISPAHTTNLTSRTVNALHPRTTCSVVEVYFGAKTRQIFLINEPMAW